MIAPSILDRVPTHQRRLDNGLTVLVREDHSAPVVAIVTHVKAGYFNEPDHVVGISHVLEHMYFKGTERRGVGEIARETQAAGGYLNASTSYDYTSYYTVLPAESLEMGLDIQSDALRHSEIDEEELRKELLVIIQEAKRKLDNPSAVARETLYEEMFDVHRIRRWRIGTEAGLKELRRAHVWAYYRNLYHPSNIVLVVAGDVDPERTFALVERHYGDMAPGQPVTERSPEEPPRRGFRFREIAGDIVHTQSALGWRTPAPTHPDTAPLDLLAIILGQGRASRLYQGVREQGLATAVGAFNVTPTELGIFQVALESEAERTLPALEAVAREVAALRSAPVAERELERARNRLEARILWSTETAQGQASLLADWQALGDWRLVEEYLSRALAATAEDVYDVARRYLDLDQATLLVYRPLAAPPLGLDAAALETELRDAGDTARPVRIVEPPGTPEPERLAPPARVREEDDVHFFEVGRGTRLAVKPRHAAPLVSMEISFLGGRLAEDPSIAGITSLMARASMKGTAQRTGAELAEATETLGGAISPGVGFDTFDWALSVPSRHFDAGFRLLAEAALHPSFPDAEVQRERALMLADLASLRDDTAVYPRRLFYQAAFEGSPYGLTLAETEAALGAMDCAALVQWHRYQVLEAERWVFVVGDVEPDAAAAVVARELEALEEPTPRALPGPIAWPDGPRVESASLGKAQSALVLGFPGPDRNHPDRYALRVLSNAVSSLGGRFFEELRSRRSLAYTVHAGPVSLWRAGAFVGYIAVSPEREEEARAALMDEFQRLRELPLSDEEVDRARRYTVGAWQIGLQTNAAQLGNLSGALMLGRGLAELREYEARIRAVTPGQILEAARRWFDPELAVEGVVRGTGGGR